MIKNNKIITILLLFVQLIVHSGCSQIPLYPRLPLNPPEAKPLEKVDVALVLSGGGARGVAHVGVLEVLAQEGIPINLIVGCSAGSIVGAFYADNPDIDCLRNKLLKIRKNELLDPSLSHGL